MNEYGMMASDMYAFTTMCTKKTISLEQIRVFEDVRKLPHCDIYIISQEIGSDIFYSIGYYNPVCNNRVIIGNFGSFNKNSIINLLEYRYARYLNIMKDTNNIPIIDWKTYEAKYDESSDILASDPIEINIDTSRFISI